MKDTRTRKWQVTINNPSEHGLDHGRLRAALEEMELEYSCMCDEIGEEGTYHTHLFVQGKNQIRFSTMKNKFPGAHFEMANGTAQQNRDYIRKEGKWAKDKKKETNLPETFEEFGECPIERPGRRTDIEDLYDWIKEGKTDLEIMEEDPRYMFNLDKIDRARQIVLEGRFRGVWRNLHVEYWWGDTGTGKTRGVYEKHGYQNVYRITDYEHPFDSYRQQPVVVFEEFRSSLKIQDMLSFLDGHPLELPCRYHNKIACYETVYLITNIPIYRQYETVQKEFPSTYQALMRRIHDIRHFGKPELTVIDGCPF